MISGLGYEGLTDDWVAHLDDFNDLLANLQQEQETGGDSKAKSSVKSLEERSKKSRARVQYVLILTCIKDTRLVSYKGHSSCSSLCNLWQSYFDFSISIIFYSFWA